MLETLEALESAGRAAVRAMTVEHEREQAKRQLEAQLAMINATLESVRVVTPPEQDDGVVRFGSVVTLTWSDGREQTVRLVGPDEADVKTGQVSIESPLARALLDAKEGMSIEVERPRGVEEATVTRVR